jgi:hypothetical protein
MRCRTKRIVARYRDDNDPGKAPVRRPPPPAGGEIRLVIAPFQAARPQRPDVGLRPWLLQCPEVLAARMVELAVDRKDPGADQGAPGTVDRPGGGDLRQVLDLLRDALVQRPFRCADLTVGQAGEQVVDTRRDQRVGIEDLGCVFGGDGNGLDQRRGGTFLGGPQRKIPADRSEQQRRHDGADQQRPQRTDRAERRPDTGRREPARRGHGGVIAVVGGSQFRHCVRNRPSVFERLSSNSPSGQLRRAKTCFATRTLAIKRNGARGHRRRSRGAGVVEDHVGGLFGEDDRWHIG